MWVGNQVRALGAVALHHPGAGSNRILVCSVLRNRLRAEESDGTHVGELDQRSRCRFLEVNGDRHRVDGLQAVEVRGHPEPVVVLLGHPALEVPDHRLGVPGSAVAEHHVGPQLERIGRLVLGNGPGFRQCGLDHAASRVLDDRVEDHALYREYARVALWVEVPGRAGQRQRECLRTFGGESREVELPERNRRAGCGGSNENLSSRNPHSVPPVVLLSVRYAPHRLQRAVCTVNNSTATAWCTGAGSRGPARYYEFELSWVSCA